MVITWFLGCDFFPNRIEPPNRATKTQTSSEFGSGAFQQATDQQGPAFTEPPRASPASRGTPVLQSVERDWKVPLCQRVISRCQPQSRARIHHGTPLHLMSSHDRRSAVPWRRSFLGGHASVTLRFFFRVLWRRPANLVVCGAQPSPATSTVDMSSTIKVLHPRSSTRRPPSFATTIAIVSPALVAVFPPPSCPATFDPLLHHPASHHL